MNAAAPTCLIEGNLSFYRLQNDNGKVWFLPSKNLKTALQLYQPSGPKGKILKNLLPFLHNFTAIRNKLNITQRSLQLDPHLLNIAKKVFNVDNFQYSLFCGTPSVHQKITIQFFKDKKILGYCKISENPDVMTLFRHEKKILDFLKRHKVGQIPVCLYCAEEYNKGMFFQSTNKTSKSYSPAEWTSLHSEFIEDLRNKTVKTILFEESDFFVSLQNLKDNLYLLPEQFAYPIRNNLNKVVENFRDKPVDFSTFHADFTPWNMFVENGKLFVFDWEYAQLTYPPGLEKYHFFIQQFIYVKNLSPQMLIQRIQQEPWINKEYLTFYILDIISRYLKRDNFILTDNNQFLLSYWISLLIHYNND